MTTKNKGIIFSSVLIVIMIVLVGFDVFLVEKTKVEVGRIMEELAKIEYLKTEFKKAEIELLKQKVEKTSIEIIEFDEKYRVAKNEYTKKVNELSKKINSEILNIDELKELTTQRINVSKKFKNKLSQMNMPEPLEDFYEFEMEFLNNDIETMALILAYYNSDSYSTYNDDKLKEAYEKSNLWFLKAEEEMSRVYREYNLEYLLES
ncbi:unnamed protein product [marine sediment metagenome]|uniref:Uncharacterized protein n=1 Tax=marine sediment metagenome TaxID=412755 RepID=X0YZA2_9ZZZZ